MQQRGESKLLANAKSRLPAVVMQMHNASGCCDFYSPLLTQPSPPSLFQ